MHQGLAGKSRSALFVFPVAILTLSSTGPFQVPSPYRCSKAKNPSTHFGAIHYDGFMKFEYHASQYNQQYTKQEEAKFAEVFSAITRRMNELMKSGCEPSATEVQAEVAMHYEFVCQFWKPTREAYKSLGMTYILPTAYKDFYDDFEKGLGKFTYDAVVIWADRNLED